MGMRLSDIEETQSWFKHPNLMLAFYLLHTDGETRAEGLGLKRVHYHDKAAVDQWREDLVQKLREVEELIDPHMYVRMMQTVNYIHKVMALDL